jgi:hypothetical protein
MTRKVDLPTACATRWKQASNERKKIDGGNEQKIFALMIRSEGVNWIPLRRSFVIIRCRNGMLLYRLAASLEQHKGTFVLRHTMLAELRHEAI